MLTTRWPLTSVWNELDRLHHGLRHHGPKVSYGAHPPMNIWADGDNYFVEAELPGWSIEELEIIVDGGEFTIAGTSSNKQEEDKRTYHRRERRLGDFKRTFTLSDDIDAEHVEAELKDGVLRIRLGKREAVKPRRIQVLARD